MSYNFQDTSRTVTAIILRQRALENSKGGEDGYMEWARGFIGLGTNNDRAAAARALGPAWLAINVAWREFEPKKARSEQEFNAEL